MRDDINVGDYVEVLGYPELSGMILKVKDWYVQEDFDGYDDIDGEIILREVILIVESRDGDTFNIPQIRCRKVDINEE